MNSVKSLKEILLTKYTQLFWDNDDTFHLVMEFAVKEHQDKLETSLNVIKGVGDWYRENMNHVIVKICKTDEGTWTYKVKPQESGRFYVIHEDKVYYFRRTPLGPRLMHYFDTASPVPKTLSDNL